MKSPSALRCLGAVLCVGMLAGCVSAKRGGADAPPSTAEDSAGAENLHPAKPTADLQLSDSELKRLASAHAHYGAGVVLELQDKRSQALREYRQAAEIAPENEEMVWEVARKFMAAKQMEVAVELLDRAAAQPQASGLTWARLAAIQLQSGDTAAAVKASREAIRRGPDLLQGYQTLFLAHLQAGDLGAARRVLDEAESQETEEAEFLIQLSELYGFLVVHNPLDREAIQAKRLEILDTASTLSLPSDTLRLRLADGYLELGRNEQAAEIYQDLLESMPDAPGVRDIVRSKLTEAYLRGKDPARAREQLKELIQRDPTNVRATYLLGSLAYEARDYAVARDYFQRVTVLQPGFEQAYYDLAGVLLNLDLADEADEIVAQARRKFPQSFLMELLSAMVHLRRGEASLALPHFTTAEITAQAMSPERLTSFFYFQFAVAAEQAGAVSDAERHLKKCLELDPDFAGAQNYLGYLWADRGEHLDEALELIQKAVAAEPENAAYLDSLGWVLFKLNRPAEALEALLKAVQFLQEPDPTVYDHLGDVYDSLQRRDQAVESWKQSYGLSPTNSIREKLERAGHPVTLESDSQ